MSIDNIDVVKLNLSDSIKFSLSRQNMNKMANALAQRIIQRVRKGLGVERDGAPERPLKRLSAKYIEARKKFKKLSRKTSPSKSNLTLSGQLIDSITGKSVSNGRGRVFLKGSRKGSTLSNEELAGYVEQAGRPFFNLSDKEIAQIERQTTLNIISTFERSLTKIK